MTKILISDNVYCIDIDKVRVLAQPLGGFYSWAFNKEGKFKVSQSELQGEILVIDIGFNTLDLYGLNNMKLEPKYTTGDTAGVRRAADKLAEYIRQQFDVRVSQTEANDLLMSSNPVFRYAGGNADLTPVIKQVLEASTTEIINICETKIGNGKQFSHIFFTGGGSQLLKKEMLKHYPFALVLPNTVMANATGCAYAGRLKWREADLVIGVDPGFGGFKVTALRRREEE